MSDETKAILDRMISKLTSRKLLVWLTATGLALTGNVTSEDWVAVALVHTFCIDCFFDRGHNVSLEQRKNDTDVKKLYPELRKRN